MTKNNVSFYDRRTVSNSIVLIVNGPGSPGEVRKGFAVTFPKGMEGEKSETPYYTDSKEKARELALRNEGSYGHTGTVYFMDLACIEPGKWTVCNVMSATDGDATEAEILILRRKQEALAKLTPEDREILGL